MVLYSTDGSRVLADWIIDTIRFPLYLVDESPESRFQSNQLPQSLLKSGRKLKQSEGVARRRSVEDYDGVVHGLDQPAHPLTTPPLMKTLNREWNRNWNPWLRLSMS